MNKNNNVARLAVIFTSAFFLSSTAIAEPAGTDQIRIQTSAPKKNGETAFSYLVAWRKGDSYTSRSNGLTFLNGPDNRKPTTGVNAAHKLATALNDAISYESPKDRGAKAKEIKGKPEFVVSNKDGFDFVQATFRDYSNQELTYSLPGKTFQAAGVHIAIDIVYASVVENIAGMPVSKKNNDQGGLISVKIGNQEAIEIKTDGKTTEQVENILDDELKANARFSKTSIYPNYVVKKSRNYKPFDGGEVQLSVLAADSITIDINDPRFGVITKFAFPDVNKPADVAGKVPYIVAVLVFAILGYALYITQFKNKGKEESVG